MNDAITNGHTPSEAPAPETDGDLLADLEKAVRTIIRSSKTSKADKLAAIVAGTKLLAIRHRIQGDDEKGFFS
jgi:hypothetical protein